jgi:DtxR family Mn-dependent transcriptional regulator
MEDYLEAVLFLVRQNRVARVRDIAARLGVGMPSVTAALKALAHRKLVNYDPYQYVTLTAHGQELAEQISRHHYDLRSFLADVLGLDSATAESNACRMEHAMDEQALERLRFFAEFIARCPRSGSKWIGAFQRQFTEGPCDRQGLCSVCLAEAVRPSRSPE